MHTLLKRRPPEEWERLISALPPNIRSGVADMVWWDFMADGHGAQHLSQFRSVLSSPEHADRAAEVAALISLGYEPEAAEKRLYKEAIEPLRNTQQFE